MITIVIADDEKLIRAGLKKILTESLGVPLSVSEAKNGIEAFELCRKEQPDILITDIRMPQMDGVELMRQVSLMARKPAIIVLSGFDDFAYAKAAISAGAVSYILKPVDKKELVSAVSNAVTELQKAEKARSEQVLRNIVDEGRVDSGADLPGCHFTSGLYCVIVTGQRCMDEVSRMLKPVQYYVLEQKKDFVCLVIPREALYLLETGMPLLRFTAGVSPAADSVSALRTLRRQAFSAMIESFFSSDGNTSPKKCGIFYYREQETLSDFSAADQRYEKIVGRLDISSPDEVQKAVKELFTFTGMSVEASAETLSYLYTKILTNLFSRFPGYSDVDMYLHLKGIMIENIWQLETLKEWQDCVCDYAVYLAALLKRNTTEYPYITEAIEYIGKHFTKNINMAMVANQVSVNYTWFSEKFKEHTGVNFNEYLKRLRLAEAESLLEKGCYKVYEVAEKAGFGDVKYFMKTFRESTGMSPTEWKKSHQK